FIQGWIRAPNYLPVIGVVPWLKLETNELWTACWSFILPHRILLPPLLSAWMGWRLRQHYRMALRKTGWRPCRLPCFRLASELPPSWGVEALNRFISRVYRVM